jgi:tetratricopeptide (TPR) repeat protein
MAWANLMLDEPGAEELWRKALRLYENAGDLVGQGYMNNNLGGLAYFEGRWDDALDYYERSREAAERLGNPVDVAWYEANIGEVLVNQHRFEEAESKLRHAIRVAQSSNEPLTAILGSLQLGRILIARREYSEAENLLARSREQAKSLDLKGHAYEAAIHLADLMASNGDPTSALELLDKAADEAQEEASIFAPAADRVRALALNLLGRTLDAVDIADSALEVARGRNLDYEVAMLLLCKASLIGEAHPETAASLREEGRQIIERLEIRPLEAV